MKNKKCRLQHFYTDILQVLEEHTKEKSIESVY